MGRDARIPVWREAAAGACAAVLVIVAAAGGRAVLGAAVAPARAAGGVRPSGGRAGPSGGEPSLPPPFALPPAPSALPVRLTDAVAGRIAPTLDGIAALGGGVVIAVGNAAFSGLAACPNQGGIYCPDQGIALVSRDGGRTWAERPVASGELEGLDAVGADAAVAWGPQTIAITTDGGASWDTPALPGPGDLIWVSFASPTDGWAAMQGACPHGLQCTQALFSTGDGGASWREIAVAGPYPVQASSAARFGITGGGRYLGDGQGWIDAGGPGERRTADGGRTWLPVPAAEAVPALLSATPGSAAWGLADGPLHAEATVSPTLVLRTADGWRTWTVAGNTPVVATQLRASPGTPGMLWAIGAPRPNLAGDADVLTSADGGRTWTTRAAPGLSFFAVAPTGPSAALAVAATRGGTFEIVATRDGGRTWSPSYHPRAAPTPGPTLTVHFWNGSDGWGSGTPADLGAILVTDDGGVSWKREGTLPGFLAQAAFADPLHGLAPDVPGAGGSGWLATADGGRSWHALAGAPPGGLLPFTLSAAAPGAYAAGLQAPGGAEIAVTADGGRAWRIQPAPSGLSRVVFTGGGAGWAVTVPGGGGTAVLWRGGGYGGSWRPVARLGAGPEWQGPLLAASGPRDVWLVSGGMSAAGAAPAWTLWHSADGGRTWTAHALPAPMADAYFGGDALTAVSPSDAWLLTRTGLWRTRDGGAAWTLVAAP